MIGLSEPISSAALMSLQRSQNVLRRELVSYDYEKVFWRSVYGVGLVGLGWASLQLGIFIGNVQEKVEAFHDVIEDIGDVIEGERSEGFWFEKNTYDLIVYYVEGGGSNVDNPYVWTGVSVSDDVWDRILLYRGDADAYLVYKADYAGASNGESSNGVNGDKNNGDKKLSEYSMLDYLRVVDRFYSRFGAVLPPAIVSYNCLTEAIRVKRLRGRLDE